MLPSIIERYVLGRVFWLAVAVTASTLAIAWTTQVLGRINLVTDTGQSAAAFLKLATLILPNVIPEVLPFAMAIAVAHALTTMNTDSELVVINASGTPRSALAKPVILLAAAAAVLAFFVQNVVEPYTRFQVRTLVATARADLLTSVIQEGSFRKIEDGLFLQVGKRLPDGRLGSVFVTDSREKNIDLYYYAKTADVAKIKDGSFLFLHDGEVHRKTPGGDVSVIRFKSYTFDLSQFAGTDDPKIMLFPKDQPISYLLNPDPNDPFYKSNPGLFFAEIHKRFTSWLYPLAFALIALAVAGDARSHRETRIHPLVSVIGTALVVRWLGYFAFGKADEFAPMVLLLYAAPLVSGALAAYFYYSGRRLEPPAHVAEWMAEKLTAISERVNGMRMRLPGFDRNRGGAA